MAKRSAYAVGVIGLGVQGRAVATELAGSGRLEVVAAFDPAVTAAADLPLVGSAAAVCSHPAVDLVYVASPPSHHAEAVRLAASAGKAVLCEKPLAPDAATANAVTDVVTAAGVGHGVNYYLATAPAGLELLSAIRSGLLGAVRSVTIEARFSAWPRAWQAAAGSWLVSPTDGGFTREVLSHFLFLADRICGPGEVVQAAVQRDGRAIERSLRARLTFAGVPVTIDAAVEGTDEDRNRFVVTGTRGVAAIEDWDRYLGPAPRRAVDVPALVPALLALLDGEPTPLPGFDTGARVVTLTDRLLA